MVQQTLDVPAVNELSYVHLAHCTFAVSDGQSLLLIDPFFSGSFEWQDKIERHLDQPSLPLSGIRELDAILISHEHGDHYDAQTLATLLAQTTAPVYAPRLVIDDAVKRGMDARRFVQVDPGQQFDVGQMHVSIYPSAGSENNKPVDRVGFLIEHHGVSLFHQGDSHAHSPTWLAFAGRVDGLIMWPHRVQEVVLLVRPKSIIFHHMDRFEPGNFFCNRDPQLELKYWGHNHPNTPFIVPERNRWTAVRAGVGGATGPGAAGSASASTTPAAKSTGGQAASGTPRSGVRA